MRMICRGDRTGNRARKLAKPELETWWDTPGCCCHLYDFDLWGDCNWRGNYCVVQVRKCKEADQEFDGVDECSQ